MEDDHNSGSTPLFAIFIFTFFAIYIVPYTLYSLFGSREESDEIVRPWATAGPKPQSPALTKLATWYRRRVGHALALQWIAFLALFAFVRASSRSISPFDPYGILGLAVGATEQDVRKAYRRLSLKYHPDKNPDPAAADYFASHVAKAYAALTDEVARQNYEKWGHPDGRQAGSLGVALPTFLFTQDGSNAPAILLGLLLFCIVLPIAAVAVWLAKRTEPTGPNGLSPETLQMFAQDPKHGIKPSQGVARLPETLASALEFVLAPPPTPAQDRALAQLRRDMARSGPDAPSLAALAETLGKPAFWKRHPGVVRAHMLLLAHANRVPVPPALKKDMDLLLTKIPLLSEEAFIISASPRPPAMCGWLAPTLASVQVVQCVVRAIGPSTRAAGADGQPAAAAAPPASSAAAAATAAAAAAGTPPEAAEAANLQVANGPPAPAGVDAPLALRSLGLSEDAVRRLARGSPKVRGPADLDVLLAGDLAAGASAVEARAPALAALSAAGVAGDEAERVLTALSALPAVSVRATVRPAECPVLNTFPGPAPAFPGEHLVVAVFASITRRVHAAASFDPTSVRGQAAAAYAPLYPFPKEERWYVVLSDDPSNSVLGAGKVPPLVRAEAAGATAVARARARALRTASGLAGAGHLAAGKAAASADAWARSLAQGRRDSIDELIKTDDESGAGPPAGPQVLGGKVVKGQTTGTRAGEAPAADQAPGEAVADAGAQVPPPPAEPLPAASPPQAFEFAFRAPAKPGRYSLTLRLLCDSWVGADRSIPVRIRVVDPSKANVEEREKALEGFARARRAAELARRQAAGEAAPEDEPEADGKDDEEADEEAASEEEYDSEEYGTEESSDDEE